MVTNKKVSIITVSYNSKSTIADAIESVLSQQYPDIEYIIVDGGSTDGTLDIIKQYGSRISKYVSERDKGIYDAMNKGLKLATGEIIGLLNSDDLLYSDQTISSIVDCFDKDNTLDGVYGDLIYVKKEDTNKVVRYWKSMPYSRNFFEYGNVPPHPALYLRSNVYQQHGNFNTQLKLAADYELMLRVMKKEGVKYHYLPQTITRMRLGGATNKSTQNVINGNREIIAAWKMNGLSIPWYFFIFKISKRLIQFIRKFGG